jgi:hypothetical protein
MASTYHGRAESERHSQITELHPLDSDSVPTELDYDELDADSSR